MDFTPVEPGWTVRWTDADGYEYEARPLLGWSPDRQGIPRPVVWDGSRPQMLTVADMPMAGRLTVMPEADRQADNRRKDVERITG